MRSNFRNAGRATLCRLLCVCVTNCGSFPESSFELAGQCRIPRLFKSDIKLDRGQLSVTLNTYAEKRGRIAEFVLFGPGRKKLDTIRATERGLEPIKAPAGQEKYSYFDVVTSDGVTDVIGYEYRGGAKFCPIDDPSILKALNVDGIN
jgi:hypothetical protein